MEWKILKRSYKKGSETEICIVGFKVGECED